MAFTLVQVVISKNAVLRVIKIGHLCTQKRQSDIELLQMEYLLLSTNVGDLTPQASMIFLPMSNFHMRQRRNEMGSKVLLKLLLSFQTNCTFQKRFKEIWNC